MPRLISTLLAAVLVAACAKQDTGVPMPEKKPVRLELHGDLRIDNYFWLKERHNPDVIAYLEAENTYTEKMMRPMAGIQKTLFNEIKSRIKQQDQSAAYKRGKYFYYYRYVKGGEYRIYARKKGSLDAGEEIMLDVNRLAGDADYFAVRGFKVSPDDRIAAFGIDTKGRRFYDLHFLDLETGEMLEESIHNATSNFEWANDSKTLLYAKQHPDTLRSYRVYRHTLGNNDDTLVYEEADETNYLGLSKSRSGQFFFLSSSQTLSTEVRYLSADSPSETPAVFLPREDNHEYSVTDGGDRFYVMSNDGAKNFRILQAPLDNTAKDAWTEVVANRDDALIEDIDVFRKFLVVTLVENGITQLEVVDRNSGDRYRIAFDEDVYTAATNDNYEYDTPWLRYTYESLSTPESSYDFNMATREHKLVKERAVLGGFDRNNYRSERLFATARDGTRIPVSMVYRKGMEKTGTTRCFNMAMAPTV